MSFVYDFGRNEFASAGINWVTDVVRAYLIDSAAYPATPAGGIQPSLADAKATHDRLDDVPLAARIASVDLVNKTLPLNNGTLDADDAGFVAVTGAVSEYVILVKIVPAGTDVDHRLIALVDNQTVTGLPVTPNGGDIILRWSDQANRILTL